MAKNAKLHADARRQRELECAGPATVARIKRVSDEPVIRIVAGWPGA